MPPASRTIASLAHEDGAGPAKPAHDGGVARGSWLPVAPAPQLVGTAVHGDEVLHPVGNAVQRPAVLTPAELGVPLTRLGERGLAQHPTTAS